MSEVRLDDGTIKVDGEWMTAADLTGRIQEKMQAGDMKFTKLASALEELNTALENSHPLKIRLVITQDDYKKLKAFGGTDDRESVRKSVMAFIGAGANTAPAASQPKKVAIKCPQCMSPIEITSDERPLIVECKSCGTSGRLTAQNRWSKLDPQ
ncbi:MAG: hypothetical protein P1P89_15240 [Desulfobacterales bacterium]|nr:hypothetical protein [Desulfobacterales bacterium]